VCKWGTYTPQKTVDYEKQLKIAFDEACRRYKIMPNFPLSCPLRVRMKCYFDKPKQPKHKIYHITKPDGDNLLKNLDALNKIAWFDDGQIIDIKCEKFYVDGVDIKNPCMVVEIETVDNFNL
jgi:Holliday junction resolvase RusA-like endonuclease